MTLRRKATIFTKKHQVLKLIILYIFGFFSSLSHIIVIFVLMPFSLLQKIKLARINHNNWYTMIPRPLASWTKLRDLTLILGD